VTTYNVQKIMEHSKQKRCMIQLLLANVITAHPQNLQFKIIQKQSTCGKIKK